MASPTGLHNYHSARPSGFAGLAFAAEQIGGYVRAVSESHRSSSSPRSNGFA
jgi:hypothetical protein